MVEHFDTTSKVSVEYFGTKMPKTSEKNFEGDVEAILGLGGWLTFASNAEAQADYDRKAAPEGELPRGVRTKDSARGMGQDRGIVRRAHARSGS